MTKARVDSPVRGTVNVVVKQGNGKIRVVNLRPDLARFVAAMELTLRQHDKKKGKDGWKGLHPSELTEKLKEEYMELRTVLYESFLSASMSEPGVKQLDLTEREAVDLANICMMVFATALETKERQRRSRCKKETK